MLRSIRRSRAKSVLALAAGAMLLLGGTTTIAAHASPGPGRVRVANSQPGWVAKSQPIGDADPAKPLTVRVHLAGTDQAGLAAKVAAVSDPKSPEYGKYLTPDQYRAAYAPSQANVDKVTAFLSGFGLNPGQIPANHAYVEATGSGAQAAKAFAVDLKMYPDNEPVTPARVGRAPKVHRTDVAPIRAAAGDATVPASLSGIVTAVSGLASQGPKVRTTPDISPGSTPSPPPPATSAAGAQPAAAADAESKYCSTYFGEKRAIGTPQVYGDIQPYGMCRGYTPLQLQEAYGMGEAIDSGLDGRGVRVAIIDAYASPTILSDANTYASRHGQQPFRTGQFNQVNPPEFHDGDACGGEPGWYGEETLDVEAVHALAPRANVTYLGAASCFNEDFLAAMNSVVDGHLADIVSDSWGGLLDEDDLRPLLGSFEATLLQAAVEGIGFYFGSGDWGDDSVLTADGRPDVDYPASSPWVTAVGGTALATIASGEYRFETGWSDRATNLVDGSWGSVPGDIVLGQTGGGGTSRDVPQPAYQAPVVPGVLAHRYGPTARRVTPDVAAVAGDPGMLIGGAYANPYAPPVYSEQTWSGTSLSCPLFAGVMALADQRAGRALGFANPALYALAGSDAFHDIKDRPPIPALVARYTDGADVGYRLISIDAPESIGIRRGYDDVTGIGTPRGWDLLDGLDPGYRDRDRHRNQ